MEARLHAFELRKRTTTNDRVEQFPAKVEEFTVKLVGTFPSECSEEMIYFHLLRDHCLHVAPLMAFWFTITSWGYRMFSGSAGEHLNEQLKVFEQDHTNHRKNRFVDVLRHFRVQTLHFSRVVIADVESQVKCSACGGTGHNKKNKLCPNNISRLCNIELDIGESDLEDRL